MRFVLACLTTWTWSVVFFNGNCFKIVSLVNAVNFPAGNGVAPDHGVVVVCQAIQPGRISPRIGDPQALNPNVQQEPAILAFDVPSFDRPKVRLDHANANDARYGISAQEPRRHRALTIWRRNLNIAIVGEGDG